jgi:hypothetical protein
VAAWPASRPASRERMALGRMGDDGGWSWPWGQDKPPSPQQNRTSQHTSQQTRPTKAEHHAVASAAFTADLEVQSTRQSSSPLAKARDVGLGIVKIRRPAERPPPTQWVNLNKPAKGLHRQPSMSLSPIAGRDPDGGTSWEAVVKVEEKRQRLLTLARSAAPIDTVFRLSLLPRTVIPRLWKYSALWVVLVVYALSATLARLDYAIDGAQAQETLETGSSFVAFIIVFFVGDSAPAPHLSRGPRRLNQTSCTYTQAIATSATKSSSTMCSTS